MAWVATVTNVTPGLGSVNVEVTCNDGAGTVYVIQLPFDIDLSNAEMKAQAQTQKPALLASLDRAKALKTALVGQTL